MIQLPQSSEVYLNNELSQISLVDGDKIYYKDVTKSISNVNDDF